jgi:hypothetical protein
MAISKTITNLERAGDEAEKIAKRVRRLIDEPAARAVNIAEIKVSGEMAVTILRRRSTPSRASTRWPPRRSSRTTRRSTRNSVRSCASSSPT